MTDIKVDPCCCVVDDSITPLFQPKADDKPSLSPEGTNTLSSQILNSETAAHADLFRDLSNGVVDLVEPFWSCSSIPLPTLRTIKLSACLSVPFAVTGIAYALYEGKKIEILDHFGWLTGSLATVSDGLKMTGCVPIAAREICGKAVLPLAMAATFCGLVKICSNYEEIAKGSLSVKLKAASTVISTVALGVLAVSSAVVVPTVMIFTGSLIQLGVIIYDIQAERNGIKVAGAVSLVAIPALLIGLVTKYQGD